MVQVRDGDAWLGVASHSLSLRAGTASSNPSSSRKESAANSIQVQTSALVPAQLIRSPFP